MSGCECECESECSELVSVCVSALYATGDEELAAHGVCE